LLQGFVSPNASPSAAEAAAQVFVHVGNCVAGFVMTLPARVRNRPSEAQQ
jgi:hypothetical protein